MANERVMRVLLTPVFRMSFPQLVTAAQYRGPNNVPQGEFYFNTEMLFEAADLEKFQVINPETGEFEFVDVRVVASQLAKKKWDGIVVKEAVADKSLHWPIHNGDQHADKKEAAGKSAEYYRDKRFLRTKALKKFAPSLKYLNGKEKVDLNRGMDSDMDKAEALFVGGNYAFAEVSLVANETAQGRYLTFYINSVCFVKPGERFGGGGSLMNRYDGIEGGVTDHDPTAGMDEEIPY